MFVFLVWFCFVGLVCGGSPGAGLTGWGWFGRLVSRRWNSVDVVSCVFRCLFSSRA